MKRKINLLLAVIILVCTVFRPLAQAATVAVPYHSQEHTQWCWAGVSQMVLQYFGTSKTQTEIATYGIQNAVNNWNYLTGSYAATATDPWRNGIDKILQNFGQINSTSFSRALSTTELDTEFTGSRPVIARLGWYDRAGHASGGHFVVVKGDTDGIISINDPWPDNGVLAMDYAHLTGDGVTAGTYTATSYAHRWTHSLTMAAAIDVVFLIDSTGSMYNDIDSVKTTASGLISNLTNKFKDYRIAVVDYRDNPDGTHGEVGLDYISNVQTPFTTNTNTAQAAIQAISIGNGLDWNEAVYSALYNTITGTDPGAWRASPVKRIVIMMGDAGGHYPAEPWAGGHSQAEVMALAQADKVVIQALLISGGSGSDQTDFTTIATSSGGSLYNSAGGSDVTNVITQIVDNVAANVRSPNGDVAALMPTFSFVRSGDGMANSPAKSFLVIEKCRSKVKNCDITVNADWAAYKRVVVTGQNEWLPKTALPKAHYRWRLSNLFNDGKILSPTGTTLSKIKGRTSNESSDNFTVFNRIDVVPGTVEQVSPNSSFTPSTKTVTYQWKQASNASSYRLKIYKSGRLWINRLVKPPKSDPGAAILETTVHNHNTKLNYNWTITSLNYDHPK